MPEGRARSAATIPGSPLSVDGVHAPHRQRLRLRSGSAGAGRQHAACRVEAPRPRSRALASLAGFGHDLKPYHCVRLDEPFSLCAPVTGVNGMRAVCAAELHPGSRKVEDASCRPKVSRRSECDAPHTTPRYPGAALRPRRAAGAPEPSLPRSRSAPAMPPKALRESRRGHPPPPGRRHDRRGQRGGGEDARLQRLVELEGMAARGPRERPSRRPASRRSAAAEKGEWNRGRSRPRPVGDGTRFPSSSSGPLDAGDERRDRHVRARRHRAQARRGGPPPGQPTPPTPRAGPRAPSSPTCRTRSARR